MKIITVISCDVIGFTLTFKRQGKANTPTILLAESQLYLPNLFHRFIANEGNFEENKISNIKDTTSLNPLAINYK
ncbi:hypothetical protein FG167_00965 [Lacinutrix sp. WUR7]|uniref:hypothetical protein n=1 Tax=Lacinutrix sp. WUR7 TaxID=2653681 RepID=UPI00193DABA1|nr:hypothetical protein [Lacinutrix sp. WUR7]QRM87848.1 hypothetical protein FG167_00965 [Lacinutrix sp. WUR7]